MHVNIPIVDRFVAYLADERHFSPYTGRCYAMDLSQYADSLCATGKITLDMAAEMAAILCSLLRRAGTLWLGIILGSGPIDFAASA